MEELEALASSSASTATKKRMNFVTLMQLEDYGVRGSSDRSNAPCVVLYYNFKTVDTQIIDPIRIIEQKIMLI